jgi:hypothetical protein
MPIEIRELHIKAVIDHAGAKSASQENNTREQPSGAASPNADELIDLCVEKVMEILKEQKER